MDPNKEVHARLLNTLLPPSSSWSDSNADTDCLKKAVASLHAAGLRSTESPVPHLDYISGILSSLQLPEPIKLHPNSHSANTQAVLSHLKNYNPSILHIHSPIAKPVFAHHLRCAEAFLPLPSHTEAASLISRLLRDAVSARKPVTLIVIHLDSMYSLLPALPVAHALADRFNCRVHATGPGCLSIFRGVPLSVNSLGLDLGGYLGVRGCGYITFGVEDIRSDYGEAVLAPAVCLRYMIEILPPDKVAKVLEDVVTIVEGVSDAMYRVEALWKVDVLAEGVARIGYVGEESEQIERAAVLADETGILELHDGALISASSILRRHRTLTGHVVKKLSELLIRTAREFELARAARSAFIARLRQCEHVEARSCDGAALCLLSVVPLGHVPPAGRWRADDEALKAVMEWTTKLVDCDASDGEVMFRIPVESKEKGEAHVAVLPKLRAEIENGGDDADMAEMFERFAQDMLFDENSARSWGVREADKVVRRVFAIVNGTVNRDMSGNGVPEDEGSNEQEPDGTVEIVEKERMKDIDESELIVSSQPEESSVRNESRSAISLDGEGPVGQVQETEAISPETAIEPEIESTKETTISDTAGARKKSRPGLWGLIFGENNSGETESDEDADNADEERLEEDYFRP